MIGNVVQYILYTLLFLAVATTIAGLFVAWHIRRGNVLHGAAKHPLAVLSLLASVSPYVGLFGTVWHIIQALGGIGGGSLNVAMIAKPIGEALYATLWGLGAAILALIAYRIVLHLVSNEEDEENLQWRENSAPVGVVKQGD